VDIDVTCKCWSPHRGGFGRFGEKYELREGGICGEALRSSLEGRQRERDNSACVGRRKHVLQE